MSEWKKQIDLYHAMGFSLFPVSLKGTFSYEDFIAAQLKPASKVKLNTWFNADPESLLAAILGEASGNILVLFFEPVSVLNFVIKNYDLPKTFTTRDDDGTLNLFYRFPQSHETHLRIFPGMGLLGEGWPCILPGINDAIRCDVEIALDIPIVPAPNWLIRMMDMLR